MVLPDEGYMASGNEIKAPELCLGLWRLVGQSVSKVQVFVLYYVFIAVFHVSSNTEWFNFLCVYKSRRGDFIHFCSVRLTQSQKRGYFINKRVRVLVFMH